MTHTTEHINPEDHNGDNRDYPVMSDKQLREHSAACDVLAIAHFNKLGLETNTIQSDTDSLPWNDDLPF